ncbi:hypothetical protein [Mucilaginibacter antarcticus]|uniref:Cbb3-type cytochrome oxidase component FixQ n=1 Tax=Mucilaginibacter antarcticus TaxID=1855725 RepID=A0ABW5XT56_9SPHI
MFKQFTEDISGNQVYLISSLGIFLIFFIVVTIMLMLLRKQYIDHMSDLPLHDGDHDAANNLLP